MATGKIMSTGIDIVREARGWIGTPFHHAARVRGVGTDCVGLLIGAAQALGLPVLDNATYHDQDNLTLLKSQLDIYCDSIPEGAGVQAGDVLLLVGRLMPNHVAVYNGDGGMIHAWRTAGGVVEHDIDDYWEKNVVGVYRFRGLS